jgi:DNA-directed RNA polymerase subunit RPC12/RpoP
MGVVQESPILFCCCLKLLQSKERQVSDMQEDILGTRRTAISETYVICARCNKPTRLRDARLIQSDVLSTSHSEFEYLCLECQKELAEGEKDLPIE